MDKYSQKMSQYAPVIVRIAMSLVFLWFGTNQWTHTSMWLSVVPEWVTAVMNATLVVHLNGLFEIIAGLCLLVGFQTRIAALLLGLHLIGIASGFGLTAIGVRDFGLSFATLSVFVAGMDVWCVDRKFKNSETEVVQEM